MTVPFSALPEGPASLPRDAALNRSVSECECVCVGVCILVLPPHKSRSILRAEGDHCVELSEFPVCSRNRRGGSELNFTFSSEKYLWFYSLMCSIPSSTQSYIIHTFKRAWWKERGEGGCVLVAVSAGVEGGYGFQSVVRADARGGEPRTAGPTRVHCAITTGATMAVAVTGTTHLC